MLNSATLSQYKEAMLNLASLLTSKNSCLECVLDAKSSEINASNAEIP